MTLRTLLAASAALMIAHSAPAAHAAPAPGPALPQGVSAEAMRIHQSMLVLDSHLDAPANFARAGFSMLDRHDYKADGTQIDLPRMIDGGLDGGFFAIYTPSQPTTPEGRIASRDMALIRGVEIREMLARHGDKFELALTPEDAARIDKAGKKVVFMSMENSQPMATDLSLMGTFYKMGVRLIGPIHFLNNELGDSATDPKGAQFHGLSPLGKDYVAMANRMGILLDASHSSDDVFDQMVALSKTPILLSHTGVKAIYDHPRNLDDERIRKLARSGGVIQLNAFSAYMIDIPKIPERDAAVAAVNGKYGPQNRRTPEQRAAARREMEAIEARWPTPRATIEDFFKHIDHAIAVAGVDHVGISGDFDGGGGVTGFESALDYPKITAHLLEKGLKPEDIQKIWSGNVLRVLAQAQKAAEPKVVAALTVPDGHDHMGGD